MRLLGRRVECQSLDRLLTGGLAGQSRAVVLRGDAGENALLGYLSERATDWHIATAAGIESEIELGQRDRFLRGAGKFGFARRRGGLLRALRVGGRVPHRRRDRCRYSPSSASAPAVS